MRNLAEGENMRRYYLHQRRGIFYAELIDQTTGQRLTAKSTGKTDRDAAVDVVYGWLKDGIPTGRHRKTRPVSVEFHLQAILEAIRKTDLDPSGAHEIVSALQGRGLIDVTVVKEGPGAVPLQEYLEKFWDYDVSPYVKEKLAHGYTIGKRHCYESMNRVRLYWIPFFDGRKLNTITKNDLKEFIQYLAEKKLAPGSINKILVAGTTAIRWAHGEGLIEADPSDGLMRFGGEPAKRGILTPEEAGSVFSVTWKDRRAYAGNLLAACTGLRAGEVLGLRRSDIGDSILYIRHSWSPYDGLKSTKTGKERRVPLYFEIKNLLMELLKENPHDVEDPYIFYGLLSDKPMDNKFLIDGLKEACSMAGIVAKDRGIVFHSWRHYFASRMADEMSADQVSRVTGHKSRAVYDEYANHVLEKAIEEVGTVGRAVFGNILSFRKGA